MDAGWFAVIGTAAGAGTTGLIDLGKLAVSSWAERGKREDAAAEAKAQRDADAAEAKAKREHDATQTLRAERRETIGRWRKSLGEASTAYKDAMHLSDVNKSSTVASRRNVQIPDIVGMQWFETLRPYLAYDEYKSAKTLYCDTSVTLALSNEIAAIETEWRGEH